MTSKCSKLKWNHYRRVVSLQSFEHFDVIAIIDKRIDRGKFFRFVFYNNIDSFFVHSRWNYSENHPRKKEKNKLRAIGSLLLIVCCLTDHSSRPAFSAQEIIIISTIFRSFSLQIKSLYCLSVILRFLVLCGIMWNTTINLITHVSWK